MTGNKCNERGKYTCDICKEKFRLKMTLENHKREHIKKKKQYYKNKK